jgi:hypothetical protein
LAHTCGRKRPTHRHSCRVGSYCRCLRGCRPSRSNRLYRRPGHRRLYAQRNQAHRTRAQYFGGHDRHRSLCESRLPHMARDVSVHHPWTAVFCFGRSHSLTGFDLNPVVGVLLIVAAWRMAKSARLAASFDGRIPSHPPLLPSIIAGAVIGFVAGAAGICGGIFVAPLVLTLHWQNTRYAAGLSAIFNLLNSAAALAGLWSTSLILPPHYRRGLWRSP